VDAAVSSPVGIEGVRVTELRQISDERGAVLHMLRADAPEFVRFGECYFSEIEPGAVKAWKCHREQTQNLAAPVGRVLLAIYDDRAGSATRGSLVTLELGRPDAYRRVSIPPGLWYGFAALGSTRALLANCPDLPHTPGESDVKPPDDPTIPFSWTGDRGRGGA
jgi:dTDP-4-dehydrorhamnose 3,5-epimerase